MTGGKASVRKGMEFRKLIQEPSWFYPHVSARPSRNRGLGRLGSSCSSWGSSGRTRERLPCGLQWRKLVELFRKKDSKFYWYDFKVRGKRYRRSTKETNKKRAEKIAAKALTSNGRNWFVGQEGSQPAGFLDWVLELGRISGPGTEV